MKIDLSRFSGPPSKVKMDPEQKMWLRSFSLALAMDLGLTTRPLDEVFASIYLSGLQHGSELSNERERSRNGKTQRRQLEPE